MRRVTNSVLHRDQGQIDTIRQAPQSISTMTKSFYFGKPHQGKFSMYFK